MILVPEAQQTIVSACAPLPAERVDLLSAAGRVLAEDIVAGRTLPAWDNSAMDGYAVRAAEAIDGADLPVAFEVAAGHPPQAPLPAGAAARIFTGAPLPEGADTVVMQENTTAAEGRVTFTQAARLGRNVRRRGSDVAAGDAVLSAGRVIEPGDVGLLAAQGRAGVAVHRAPVVAIAASGDELLEVDQGEPGPGQIVNSNTIALAAAVRLAGCTPRVLPIIPDDAQATRAAIAAAARDADVLLTSGGVSVGDHDHIGHALRDLGDLAFWKVAVKPGKPLAFGRIGQCLTFGLPGNPISALVGFELFVRPALLRLQGHRRVFRAVLSGRTDAPIAAGGRRETYLRAALRHDGEWRVDPRRPQSSGALASLAAADALVRIPMDAPAKEKDAVVEIIALGPDRPAERRETPVSV